MRINITEYFDEDEIYIKPDIPSGLPLNLAKRLNPKLSMEDIRRIRIGGYGKYIKLPLIFDVDEDWFYISELLRTDGHISKNFNTLKLTNNSRVLKKKFRDILEKIGAGYFREKEQDRIQIFNRTLALIFVKVFQIPAGNKTFSCRMPKWMKEADSRLLACALRGAFDGDGCVQLSNGKFGGGHTRRLRLYGASVGYLRDIKESLLRFNISSRIVKDPRDNRTYFLQISKRDDILRYAQNIGFEQPKRKDALSRVVASYRNYYFLRDFEVKVTKILKENGPQPINSIAKKINRKDSTVSEQITKLEKLGKLKTKRIGVRRFVSI